MATHFSILAWKIPGTEEPGRSQSMWSHRVKHDGAHTHTNTHRCHYSIIIFYVPCFCFQQHSECIPCPRYCMRLGGSKMKHGLDTQEIRNLIFKNKKVREVSLAQKSESVSHSLVSDSATPGTVCSLPSSSVR